MAEPDWNQCLILGKCSLPTPVVAWLGFRGKKCRLCSAVCIHARGTYSVLLSYQVHLFPVQRCACLGLPLWPAERKLNFPTRCQNPWLTYSCRFILLSNKKRRKILMELSIESMKISWIFRAFSMSLTCCLGRSHCSSQPGLRWSHWAMQSCILQSWWQLIEFPGAEQKEVGQGQLGGGRCPFAHKCGGIWSLILARATLWWCSTHLPLKKMSLLSLCLSFLPPNFLLLPFQ